MTNIKISFDIDIHNIHNSPNPRIIIKQNKAVVRRVVCTIKVGANEASSFKKHQPA